MQNLPPNTVAFDGDFHHQQVHTRGIRLHAATSGEPHHPAVVLIHDSYTCWGDFQDVLPLLARHGIHAIAIDIRGYGMSDKPPVGYDLRHLTGDIAGVIRTLGHTSAHIVGVGTGATLAWTLATSHPDHVASVTSCGAIHPLDMRKAVLRRPWFFSHIIAASAIFRLPSPLLTQLWRWRSRFIRRDLRNNTSLKFQLSPGFAENVKVREMAMAISGSAPAVVRTSRLCIAQPPAKWAQKKVEVPVHLLADDSRQSAALINAARHRHTKGMRITTLPGTRLRPHLENPEEFSAHVAAFVLDVHSTTVNNAH